MSACVVIEIASAEEWPPFKGCKLIPCDRRPSVLHPSRAIAEEEARRLAAAHPFRRFAVFEAATAAITVTVPSHITLDGRVFAQSSRAALVEISEDEVPF